MSRTHIHLAQGLPGDSGVISGMRRSAQVLVYIDIRKAQQLGCRFFVSSNGVILTEGIGPRGIIPTEAFERVEDRENRVSLEFTRWSRPPSSPVESAPLPNPAAAEDDAASPAETEKTPPKTHRRRPKRTRVSHLPV